MMADLSPEDIKDPEEAPPPAPPEPAHEPPDDDEDDEEEEPTKEKPDLAAAAKHLIVAVTELARQSGSHPAVVAALDKARTALGK